MASSGGGGRRRRRRTGDGPDPVVLAQPSPLPTTTASTVTLLAPTQPSSHPVWLTTRPDHLVVRSPNTPNTRALSLFHTRARARAPLQHQMRHLAQYLAGPSARGVLRSLLPGTAHVLRTRIASPPNPPPTSAHPPTPAFPLQPKHPSQPPPTQKPAQQPQQQPQPRPTVPLSQDRRRSRPPACPLPSRAGGPRRSRAARRATRPTRTPKG